MKKIMILILVAMAVASCNVKGEEIRYTKGGATYIIYDIDSCEYIRFSDVAGAYFIHRGNCKYCAERDKRLEELIQELKEE